MTTPLDLEAMAAQLYITLCRMEYDNVQGYRLPEKAILSALREVVGHGNIEWGRRVDELNRQLAQKDAEILRLTELLSKADSRAVELRKALEDYGEHYFSCHLVPSEHHDRPKNPKCTCGLEKLLNESNEKGEQ